MAQTLRYLDELLAATPDNTAGLITPEVFRDTLVSLAVGAGFLADVTPVSVPIVDGVPTSMNPLLPSPLEVGAGWTTDANNFMHPDYATLATTTVPPGYLKLAQFVAVLSLTKVAGGEDSYELQFTEDAVLVGVPEAITFSAAGSTVVTIITSQLVDLSINPVFGVSITGIGTSDDLTLDSFELSVSDKLLWSGGP